MTISYTKVFIFLFLIITFESILRWSIIPDLPFLFWTIINIIFFILFFIILQKYYHRNNESPLLVINLFLIWTFIEFLRGTFVADNYWEWKNLFYTGFIFLIPLLTYIFVNEKFLKMLLSIWLKFMIFIGILLIPFVSDPTFYGHYFSPIFLLLLLLPILPFRWKIIVIFLFLFIMLTGLESRSTIIKFGMAFLLGLLFYFKVLKSYRFFKILHVGLFVLPFLLLVLALTNTFNVFKIKDYAGTNTEKTSKRYSQGDLSADTRTFIYVENIQSAIKHNYIIEGRTPARGYDSKSFGDYTKWILGTGKEERNSSEVSILNIFTWYGMIGVFLYFLIFFYSSYLAIYKSNNYFIKVVGLFIAFRWVYSFVEDFASIGIQTIILWALIAMCFSSSFRNMTDIEFKTWVRELLNNASLFRFKRY